RRRIGDRSGHPRQWLATRSDGGGLDWTAGATARSRLDSPIVVDASGHSATTPGKGEPRAMRPSKNPAGRRRRWLSYERRITLLAARGGVPGVATALSLLWTGDFAPRNQWTLSLFLVVSWAILVATLRERTIRPIQTLANLLSALHEGDYSMRPT